MENSNELCKAVSALSSGSAICSFSMGKDSIAAFIQMKRYFERVELVFMYMVPGLEFQETALSYYESKLGVKIKRMPNPSLYRQIDACMYQPPQRIDLINELGLYVCDYDEVFSAAKIDYGLPVETFVGVGVRAADSLARRAACKQTGGIIDRRKIFWPVYDWNMAKVISEIRQSGIKLPVDYKIWGRTFDGFDYRFLKPLKQNFPNDYKRVMEFFPLAELEIFRYEQNR